MIIEKKHIEGFINSVQEPITGVFGSSKTAIQPAKAKDFAIELGRKMPYNMLTGGSTGLPFYTALYSTMWSGSRRILSVSPFANWEKHSEFFTEHAKTDEEVEEIKDMMYAFTDWIFLDLEKGSAKKAFLERNHYNVRFSDTACILPGTEGTLNELELMIKADKPVILSKGLNTKFDDDAAEVVNRSNYKNVTYCDDPIEIVKSIEKYKMEN